MGELVFKEEGHEYFYDGVRVPSVTQILKVWIPISVYGVEYYCNTFTGTVISAEKFREAGDHGRAIHKATKLILTDGLDWDSLDPSLVPPLNQFEEWRRIYKVIPILIETPMYSKKLGVAGTPDIICRIMVKGNLATVDIKTGDLGVVEAQVTTYDQIHKEAYKCRASSDCFSLHLPKDGSTYQFRRIENRIKHFNLFKSRLYQFNYLRGR